MVPDTVAEAGFEAGAEVMASVEDGPIERFVIADITRDEAYLTAPLEKTASLSAWR
jgi:hypothetical protein